MRPLYRKLLFLLICLMPLSFVAQEAAPKDKAPATSKAKKKAMKKKWKEQRKIEKAEKKAVKAHHKRIQDKETRKRMKKERRKGDKMRANKKEFFLFRWIKSIGK